MHRPLLCNKRRHPKEKPTHRNQRVDPGTRECLRATWKNNIAKNKQKSHPSGRKHSERVGSTHPTPSKNSPHFPPVYRGEVNLPWSWVWCSYTGVLSTRITRRKRRAAERQSRFIFMALQEGSWGCWGWTGLLVSWLRGWIRWWGREWNREELGQSCLLCNAHLTMPLASVCKGSNVK